MGAKPKRHFRTPATAPGPTGGEMLRSFNQIRTDALGFLEWSWRTYGDVVQFPIPTPPTYLVTHPEGVRRVLQANHRGYGKATIQYRNLALVTGEGLLAADTDAWRRQRKSLQPAFHPRAVVAVADHAAQASLRLADDWRALGDGAVVDVEEAMMRTALEIVGAALFGADLRDDAAELVTATQAGLSAVVARTRNPLAPPLSVPTPGNLRLRRALARLNRAVAEIVAVRRSAASTDEPRDMLDVLLADGSMSSAELRDQIVTFIVAGHETVASSLTWAWHLLGAHPEVAQAVAAEADEVLGERVQARFDDLPALGRAAAVFDESLRLFPPGWLISRNALQDDEVLGHHIPAGALVLISPYLVHRHPAADPGELRFDPDRFRNGPPSPVAGTYIPFGAGPRLCIGRDMARAEGTIVIAMLARSFRLTPLPGHAVVANPMVMLKPKGGLPMRLSKRTDSSTRLPRPD
ncbi:MAG: cytochrome P450 [Actinobacteria bacterium]|nr:cytochrome P450 [Actinomycetota bacterium]